MMQSPQRIFLILDRLILDPLIRRSIRRWLIRHRDRRWLIRRSIRRWLIRHRDRHRDPALVDSAPGSVAEADATGGLRLSVVVPAYCEAQRIASTVSEIRSELASLDAAGDLEIVVVDDGSPDGTARRARQAGADLVVELPANRGKGAAVRAGVLASRGRTVAFTDADLAYSPDQLLGMLAAVEAGCEVVIGNRYAVLSVADRGVSGLRRLGSRAVNLFARTVLSGRYRDTQCGCKAFRADVAETLTAAGRIDGFAFDVELLHLAERRGFAVAEVPVRVVNSGPSTVRALKDGFRVVRDVAMIRRLSRRGQYRVDVHSAHGPGDERAAR